MIKFSEAASLLSAPRWYKEFFFLVLCHRQGAGCRDTARGGSRSARSPRTARLTSNQYIWLLYGYALAYVLRRSTHENMCVGNGILYVETCMHQDQQRHSDSHARSRHDRDLECMRNPSPQQRAFSSHLCRYAGKRPEEAGSGDTTEPLSYGPPSALHLLRLRGHVCARSETRGARPP